MNDFRVTLKKVNLSTHFYKKSTGVMKWRILGCIFSEIIYFNEEKDATIIYTKPIEVIFQIFNELQSHKIKKQVKFDLFSQIAPLISGMLQPFSWFKLKNYDSKLDV